MGTFKGICTNGKVVIGRLEQNKNNCYIVEEDTKLSKGELAYFSTVKYKVIEDSLRKHLEDGIFEGDIYLNSEENKLIRVNSLEDIKPKMIKISDDYNKLILNELDLFEWFEPQSDFKCGDIVYEYIPDSEIETEKVIYSGVTVIITEFELDGKIQRNVYGIDEFKRMFENENKWSRWFQYKRISYSYEIPTLVNVQYRIKNKKQIQMRGRSKLNGKMLKVSCKLAEGDVFSVYEGTRICALKLHKKILDLRIKKY